MTVSTRREYVKMIEKQIEAENKSLEESTKDKGDVEQRYREGA